MRVKPLQDGSRSVEIDTAYLLLNATANTDGTVTVHACEVREPRKPSVTEANIPSRGLGDTIAKVTKAVGIKPCGGCKARQAKLNTLVPYKVDNRPA